MTEIVRINLENEMDLILAHKRTMKLAELCGLSPIVQTSFATAVSEISRCVIGNQRSSILMLGLTSTRGTRKEMTAVVTTSELFGKDHQGAVIYARRLSNDVQVIGQSNGTKIVLTKGINFSGLINDARIEAFITYFKKELPLSPYDELRKKNIQLIELSDKLRESETQYKTLTETLPLMMFTTNAGGQLTYANKWLKDFFAFPEIEPGKLSWLTLVDLKDAKQTRDSWSESMIGNSVFRMQARLKSKKTEDTSLWHLISVLPVKNDQNQLTSWTGFFVDIHAQKLVEETLKNNVELKNAQKQLLSSQVKLEEKITELNKSNHDLEQFAYIASHDLQEPLRKIRTFSELLEIHIDNADKRKKYLTKIDQSSERMSTLISDVLNYSRLSKSEKAFTQVSLQEVIDAIRVDMELLVEEKGAKFTVSELPVISGIHQQLVQLFYNLVSNSLKFTTTEPHIQLTARFLDPKEVDAHAELSKGIRYVEITHKDNGIGFDQKYVGQIFTIFKRLNTQEAYSGTGIGLALCKKIVDNHHGIIAAESSPGNGAEFRVTLPVD
jgi:PAS domain S-box-containing protein